jgi:hypothetical protein
MLIFESIEIVAKKSSKKVQNQKWQKMEFFHFYSFLLDLLASNFLKNFLSLSKGLSASDSAFFSNLDDLFWQI